MTLFQCDVIMCCVIKCDVMMTSFNEQKRKVYQNADVTSDQTFVRVSFFKFLSKMFHQKFFPDFFVLKKFSKISKFFLIFKFFSENVKVTRIIRYVITQIMMVKKDLVKERMFGLRKISPKNFKIFKPTFLRRRKILPEHLMRHCHCCMATYPCFTRNRFCPIRKPEIEKTRYFKTVKDRLF